MELRICITIWNLELLGHDTDANLLACVLQKFSIILPTALEEVPVHSHTTTVRYELDTLTVTCHHFVYSYQYNPPILTSILPLCG